MSNRNGLKIKLFKKKAIQEILQSERDSLKEKMVQSIDYPP
jgi:hypothetical protein